MEAEERYHAPVGVHQRRMASEAIVDGRHEATEDEDDDAEIVKLATERSAGGGVVCQQVACGREPEACCRREEEAGEGIDVRACRGRVPGIENLVELKPSEDEADRAEEVGPHVNLILWCIR